jgi:acyl-CoA reductase-like NAD-dependent aldehyde dehydrogenase
VDRVVAAAAKAFEAWSETGPSARRALLLKAADLMESRTNDFTKLMLEETGATAPWAGFNVHLAAGILREAAALTTQMTGEVIPSDKPGILSMAIRQPVGVILGIAPWNAPVILGTRAIAAALACGNAVILRLSELLPGHASPGWPSAKRRWVPNGCRQRHQRRATGCAEDRRSADC